jgi:AcrR family transcriptional regulator
MSLRERKKLATRKALIDASRRLIREKGYDGATLEEICQAANIHVTTFFSYFPNKEELAFAHLHDAVREFTEGVRQRPEGMDVLTYWWDYLYHFGTVDRAHESVLMSRVDTPALRQGYANINRLFEEALAAALTEEAGKEPGADLYAELLASTIMGAVVTASQWHRRIYGPDAAFPDTHAFARMLADRFPRRDEVRELTRDVLKAVKLPLRAPRRTRRDR